MTGKPKHAVFKAITTVLLFSASSYVAAARPVTPTKVPRGPLLDGDLSDACWQDAAEHVGFITLNTKGPDAAVVRRAMPLTKFKVIYDEKKIYLGVECYEPNMDNIAADTNTDDVGAIWRDDAVEIFLDPSGRRDDYFHFIFNTLGIRYDAKVTHGGGIVTWSADWDVAVRRRTESWTAEVSIPFYSLEIFPRVTATTWRLNIVRTRRAGGAIELTTWARLKMGYHEPDRFVPLGPIDLDFSRFCYSVGKPVRHSVMKAGALDTSIEMNVMNETGKDRSLDVEGWLVTPTGKVLVKSTPIGLNHSERKRVRLKGFAVREQGEYTLYVLINDDATRHISSCPLDIRFAPLEIVLEEPSYRATIFATQELDQVRLRVRTGLAQTRMKELGLRVSLTDLNDSALAAKEIGSLSSRALPLSLPCEGLSTGDYTIVAKLVDREGKVVAATTHELHKLPPPHHGSEVRVDEKLNLVVNGEALYPFGWYGYAPPKTAKDKGYTVLYVGSTMYWSAERFLKRLDEYHEQGIMVMTAPAPRQDIQTKKTSHTPDERRKVIELVRAIKDHPAHLGWFMADEPECGPVQAAVMEERYDLLRREDPYHPCVILNNSVEGLFSYVDAADILWPDPYPMFLKEGGSARPITRVSLFMDKGYEASQGRKPMWVCPQAFPWSNRPECRAPSFVEQRCQTYLAVNHGAKGILYFAAAHAHNDPDLIFSIPYLAREIGYLAPVLLHGKRKPLEANPQQPMDVSAWRHRGRLYAIAINFTRKRVQAEIALDNPSISRAKVIAENRFAPVVNGAVKDSFEPYDVHIYTSALKETGLPTVQETLRKMEAFRASLHKKGNVAFGAKVSASDSLRPYRLKYVVDGIVNPPEDAPSYGWETLPRRLPAWCQIDFGGRHNIGKVVLCSREARDYDIQYWNGDVWKTIVSVKDNTEQKRIQTFEPVTTDKIRVLIKAAETRFIVTEIEAYEAGAE